MAAGLDNAWLVYATPGAAASGVATQTIRGRRIHRVGIDLDREPEAVLAGVEALAERLGSKKHALTGGSQPAASAGASGFSAPASSAAWASMRLSERPAASSQSSRPLEDAPSTTAAASDGELNS